MATRTTKRGAAACTEPGLGGRGVLIPLLLLGVSCVRVEKVSTVASHPPPPVAPVEDATPTISFAGQIQPILARCTPCHFPGGKMYDRLPFDRAETVYLLREKLFTRLKDEAERQLIRDFLQQKPPGPGT